MAERSDNVVLADVKDDQDLMVQQLLARSDAELATLALDVKEDVPAAVPAVATPAVAAPAIANVVTVSDVKEDITLPANVAAPDVKAAVPAAQPARVRCTVIDGIVTFACPICGGTGYERSIIANTGPFLHGRRTNFLQSADAIENMYIQTGVTGCGRSLRVIAVQTAAPVANDEPVYESVVDDPWVNPATLSQDQLIEYNNRKKLGTLPPPKRATNSVILSQDELLRNARKAAEPQFVLEYYVEAV